MFQWRGGARGGAGLGCAGWPPSTHHEGDQLPRILPKKYQNAKPSTQQKVSPCWEKNSALFPLMLWDGGGPYRLDELAETIGELHHTGGDFVEKDLLLAAIFGGEAAGRERKIF